MDQRVIQERRMGRTSKEKAMLAAKCPRCRRGEMFSGGPYHFGSNRIHIDCPVCRMIFEIEPGYFYAAMYVSYAMNVAEGIALAVLTWLITGNRDSPWLYISVILGGLLLLSPLNFRYSRVMLLYWLSPKIHYRPELDAPAPIHKVNRKHEPNAKNLRDQDH